MLINEQVRGELCDFGLAFLLDDPVFQALRSELKGSTRWRSPEALFDEAGVEADVWALGCLVWEVSAL